MAHPPSPYDDPFEFLRVLWSLDHALQAASKRMLARHGVTGPQRSALRIIARTPGLAAGDLAYALQDHPSTITGILKRLVERGLVHREIHPRDRRKLVLTLTDAGRSAESTVTGTVEAAVRKAFERLEKDDVRAACRVFGVLVEAIEEETQPSRHSRRG